MSEPVCPIARREFISAVAGSCLLAPGPGFASPPLPAAGSAPRREVRLETGWRFSLGNAADPARDFGFGHDLRTFAKAGADTADAAMPRFDDSGWQSVQVPHDWAVDLPYAPPASPPPPGKDDPAAEHGFKAIGRNYPQNSIGWYRHTLPVGAADRERAVWLEFDGVFRNCIVFVNGYVAGGNASGYVPFRVEIGDLLDYDGGPNVLTLRVDASLGEGWFYEGAGIYRHVTLVSAAAVHVPQWGVFVRNASPGADGRLTIETRLANSRAAGAAAELRHTILSPHGDIVARAAAAQVQLPPRGEAAVTGAAAVATPLLWSPEAPNVYRLVTEVVERGAVVDRVETRFGIRSVRFDPQHGFFINGRSLKLLGTCNHHDHAGVGTAIPDALHAWRVAQLKGMGSNAWRSAHNPAAQVLLDACDAQGMMMIVEARLNSTSDEALSELDRMVLSARNHPCVILWSVGNEEPHQGSDRGKRISAAMVARVKALDPTRPTTQAIDQGWDHGAAEAVDVVGFNYRTNQIPAFHQRHPNVPVIGTETASTVATRGEYQNDPARQVVRAYDTEHPWWATTAEEWWPIVADNAYIGGGFIWTGFDYRGEPTPFARWPSVSSYFGVLDLCGFPKDNYYYYRACWRPGEPLVHLLPHWNWAGREGQPIEVWVYANTPEVELLLNGATIGRKTMPRNGHVAWKVPYRPGRIEARGISGERVLARDIRETASAPAQVRIASDRTRLSAGSGDVAVIRAEARDAAGRFVPTASNEIAFALSGPARLIGVGNGDPTSHEPDHASSRTLFNGLARALVQTTGAPGRILLTATSPGLRPGTVELFAHSEA